MGRTMAVVLFSDLVGSTELRGRLGEEATDELRRRHDQLLAQAVEANNGRVVKGLGDGVMATFGGASDGVAAAVAIQQGIDRLNRTGKAPVPLAVRVGLSAGDVAFEDDDVHGTPVIEASRLCGAAGAGEILVSEIVRLLAGLADEDLGDRGDLELKGLRKPVPAWEVDWEPVAVSTIPIPALLTDVGQIFVGRDAELERLGQLWKESTAGERRVVLLAGEPGVGKTRLAAEMAMRAHAEGGVVLAGRCDEDLGVPYQPFVAALRHFFDHTSPGNLAQRLGRYGGELARLVPELSEQVPDLQPPLQSDPETERYRLFDAVANWLGAASAEEPLFLVLDDLQWAAKPTLLLLRHVVRASDVRRLLIVGTYRDTELTHDHPLIEVMADLRRDGAVKRLPLTGLDDLAVAAIVEQAAGRALDDDGAALARAIYEETEGNPFFVREVLRHLDETNAIERAGGRWRSRVPIDVLGIPEGVRDVVGRRLSRLSATANQALRVAAVVGPEFEVDLVQAAGDLVESELLHAIEEAVEARLVSEVATTRFRFSHALVRTTLYESLTGPHKTALHRHVAEGIEQLHQESLDEYLPALAHHWAKATAPAVKTAKAIDYARRAGDWALNQLAHDDAVAYYRQGLALLDADDPHSDVRQRVELLISLGEAQRRVGDAAHRETLLKAGHLALQSGDAVAAARAALANQRGALSSRLGEVDDDRVAALERVLEALGVGHEPMRARLLASLANELYFACDERRRDYGRQALTIARRQDDPAMLAQVLGSVWFAIWDPAAAEERNRLVSEFADLAQRVNDRSLRFEAGFATFLTACQQADMARADAALDSCAAIADELAQPTLRWRVSVMRNVRAMAGGDLDQAERVIRESIVLGELAGQPDAQFQGMVPLALIQQLRGRADKALPTWETMAGLTGLPGVTCVLAWAYADLGRIHEASALVDTVAVNDFEVIPRDHNFLTVLCGLARACSLVGDREVAAKLYRLLLPHEAEVAVVITSWLGPASHDLGLLARTFGALEYAEGHFARAAELQERIGALTTLAHTRLEWGRMLLTGRHPGDSDRARGLLGQALAAARELGLAKVERDAAALLQ